jgi:ribosomal protein S18 acetylase RimI-like enzyme
VLLRAFDRTDTAAVIDLWRRCDLVRAWNDPQRDIDRKLSEQPELFIVAVRDGTLIGSAMAGFDGHRGWIYYLAVDEAARHGGVGRVLVERLENDLRAVGCPKVQLMVRSDHLAANAFYDRLDYGTDAVVVRSKRLISD